MKKVAFTLDKITIWGDSAVSFTLYRVNATNGARTSIATGVVNTELDIANTTLGTHEYFAVIVSVSDLTGHTIYGGYLDGTGGSNEDWLVPSDFMVNDDQ